MKITLLLLLGRTLIHYPWQSLAFAIAFCLVGALLLRILGHLNETRLLSKGLEMVFVSMLLIVLAVAGGWHLYHSAGPDVESRTDAAKTLR